MIMENKDSMQKSQPGTGSSENRGQERNEQQNRSKDQSQREKQDIARQIGEKPGKIASQRDTGILSGRDDSSAAAATAWKEPIQVKERTDDEG